MFLRPRQQEVPQRRVLAAVGMLAAGAVWCEARLFASDPWVARQAINQVVPLSDPLPPNHRPYRASSSPVTDMVPRSTLRFVVPEGSYAKPSAIAPSGTAARATANKGVDSGSTVSQDDTAVADEVGARPSSLALHSLYGPGQPSRLAGSRNDAVQPLTGTPDSATGSRRPSIAASEWSAGIDQQRKMDPEQNEPAANELAPPANVPPADEPADKSLEDSVASDASRIQVRGLKLGVNGSVDPPSLSRRTQAEPVGSRAAESVRDIGEGSARPSNSEHQTVGDQPLDDPVPLAISRDRIGPKGDLIFGLGLASPHNRVAPATTKLRAPIERTLNYYWNRPENTQERTHWGMFHAIMVYDKDTQILDGKKRYNAVAWMAGNNPCRNELLFEQDQQGINVKSGIGLQGHQAQLLSVLGLIDVPAAYPIYVGRSKYSVDDVIRREMRACKSGNELTFTLIGLSHYIDTDSQWVADDGRDWDFERLIHEELSQPVVGAACGGTHRLMGFAHSLRRRRAEGKPIEGQWARADQYVNDFIVYTWQLQNRDGSMSTAWFEAAEDNGKLDRKIQTTGHMVEFLVTALPDDQLQSPQMLRAVSYLVETLFDERGHEWQIGPKGHALRAIAMYYQRVFGRQDPWRPVSIAGVGTSKAR